MGLRRRRRLYSSSVSPLVLFGVVLIVLCSSFVNGNSNSTQIPITPINHDLYHTRGALLEEIESLVHRHPSKLSMETFSTQNKGYHAETTVVTYCRNKKDCDDRSKLKILLSFGQHGRELITTELALRILSILSEEEFLSSAYPLNLNNTLDRLVIKVVPMENVNGRKLVEAGDLCERRNGRGVDLNRNWSVDWGKKEKDYDPYEENPGSAPFSEPETQIMRKICASFEPHVWVNVHSGMEALFMPYDHKNTTPEGLPSQRMRLMLEKLNRFQLNDRCLVGSGGGSVGYLVDAASGGFIAPFLWPDLEWDFRLPLVKSINVSGHKYGLVYAGVGWVIWRSKEDLPDELVFHINYLGSDQPTFTLNFSKGSYQIIAQYYQLIRLGFEGYKDVMENCLSNAKVLTEGITKMGRFDIVSKDVGVPVVAFSLRDSSKYTVFEVSEHLRRYGWIVPAYTMPPDAEHIAVLRVVIREDFSHSLAERLVSDIEKILSELDTQPPRLPTKLSASLLRKCVMTRVMGFISFTWIL